MTKRLKETQKKLNNFLNNTLIYFNILVFRIEKIIDEIIELLISEFDFFTYLKMFLIATLILFVCMQFYYDVGTSHVKLYDYYAIKHDLFDSYKYNALQEKTLKIQHYKMTKMAEIIRDNQRYTYTLTFMFILGSGTGFILGVICEGLRHG